MLELTKQRVRASAVPVARALVRLGVTANQLTLLGLLLNAVVAVVLAAGQLLLGGVMLMLFNVLDLLDGTVARETGSAGRAGAFLDSIVDRYSEATVFMGLLYRYLVDGQVLLALVVYTAAMGSILVSYARARAEGLGVEGAVGLLQRPERIVLLGIGLLAASLHEAILPIVLVALAVLAHITVLQRLYHVTRRPL